MINVKEKNEDVTGIRVLGRVKSKGTFSSFGLCADADFSRRLRKHQTEGLTMPGTLSIQGEYFLSTNSKRVFDINFFSPLYTLCLA